MSVVLPSGVPRLEKAVEAARRVDVVKVGSRGDHDSNREIVYPADHDELVSISSFTSFGKRIESTETFAQYFFQGENSAFLPNPAISSHKSKPLSRRLGNEEREMD